MLMQIQQRKPIPHEPLVSVVIPTFNCGKYLGEAIESILAQTYKRLEICVVDDGSTDSTQELLKRFSAPVRTKFQKNAGQAVARNAGMKMAKGEVIAILDSDDRWLPKKLERQLPLFQSHPDVALLHTGIRFFQQDTGRITSEYFAGGSVNLHDLLGFHVLATQTLTFPAWLIAEMGGFDPSVQGCEDWDFCIRAAALYPTAGVDEILAEVRGHGEHFSHQKDRMFAAGMRVVDKNATLHHGARCAECRSAVRRARRKLHGIYYQDLNRRSKDYLKARRPFAALRTSARALWHDPGALVRLPGRLLQGAAGFSKVPVTDDFQSEL